MWYQHSCWIVKLELGILVLTIFNEGAILTFRSIFHKALNSFRQLLNLAQIRSWNQPVLNNEVNCSRTQWEIFDLSVLLSHIEASWRSDCSVTKWNHVPLSPTHVQPFFIALHIIPPKKSYLVITTYMIMAKLQITMCIN